MKAIVIISSVCLLAACKPVDFAKPNQLSVQDRASAVATLRANAAALNAGDLEALERTLYDDSEIRGAQQMIAHYAPVVGIRGVKVASETRDAIVMEYEQTIEVRRGQLPFTSALVQSTLSRTENGWGIVSTRVLNLLR